MNLTIIAATGGIGQQLVDQAIAQGHNVTAVVRKAKALSAPVPVFVTNLVSPESGILQAALAGADAVLSGLGARSSADHGVATRGTEAILQAMQVVGVRRIVVVSAAPIGTVPSPDRPNPPKHDPGDGFFMRHLMAPLIKVVLRDHYADLARMEDALRASNVEWTIVRPPRLTNGPISRRYRTAYGENLRRGLSISRADVAHFMLHSLGERQMVKQVIGIAD